MRTSTNRIRKLVCLVIAFVISIFPVPLTSLALEEDVSYYSVQDNLSYEVVTRITSSWDKHQNIEMTFVNTGYEVIHNWYFLYNSPYEITNIWNSEIVESDSNGNGISDFDEDYDMDGISNGGEYLTGTCAFASDSDYDGLSDYEECYIYGTNPRLEDTDEDGISDGDEIILGLNPLLKDSNSDGIEDNYETSYQELTLTIEDSTHPEEVISVKVEGEISGLITSNTKIEDMYDRDVMSKDLPGLIGVPVSIESEGYFTSMVITFSYDESKIVNEDNLCIVWFDEENCEYVILEDEQILDRENNEVSYITSHFSEYMLVDLYIYLSSWEETITTIEDNIRPLFTQQSYDYYFAFDISEHMTREARAKALDTFKTFVYNMGQKDRMCPFFFDTDNKIVTRPLYKEEIEANMSVLEHNILNTTLGGEYGSLRVPFLVTNYIINQVDDVNNEKVLYILTNDTEMYHANNYIYEIMLAKNSGDFDVVFAMMEHKDNTNWDFAWKYALETGSEYVEVERREYLYDLHEINQESLLNKIKDSDLDGIPNIVELPGIALPNGKIVYTDPYNADTDGDGLTDGEELEILGPLSEISYLSRFFTNIDNIQYARTRLDPTKVDTDEDGYEDSIDANPNKNPDRVYVFCSPDFTDESRASAEEYRNAGYDVKYIPFYNQDSFNKAWDDIGKKDKTYYYDQTGWQGKYWYNAKFVTIMSHGNNHCFTLNSADEGDNTKHLWTSDFLLSNDAFLITKLSQKRIDTLVLFSCLTGQLRDNGDECLAEEFFLYQPGIERVIAPDTLLFLCGLKRFFLNYNNVYYCDKEDLVTQDFTAPDGTPYEEKYNLTDCSALSQNSNGYILYGREEGERINYYSGDVHTGYLYCTEDSKEGVIAFTYSVLKSLDSWGHTFDPVLEASNLI